MEAILGLGSVRSGWSRSESFSTVGLLGSSELGLLWQVIGVVGPCNSRQCWQERQTMQVSEEHPECGGVGSRAIKKTEVFLGIFVTSEALSWVILQLTYCSDPSMFPSPVCPPGLSRSWWADSRSWWGDVTPISVTSPAPAPQSPDYSVLLCSTCCELPLLPKRVYAHALGCLCPRPLCHPIRWPWCWSDLHEVSALCRVCVWWKSKFLRVSVFWCSLKSEQYVMFHFLCFPCVFSPLCCQEPAGLGSHLHPTHT